MPEKRNYEIDRARLFGRNPENPNLPAQWITFENQFLRDYLQPHDYIIGTVDQPEKEEELIFKFAKQDDDSSWFLSKKSESLSWYQLGQLYVGRDEWLVSEEDEEEPDPETPRKRGRPKGSKTHKSNTPKPVALPILGQLRTFAEWLDLRDKARKDLLFLGTNILKCDFIERVHRQVADIFVQKNFDGKFRRGYTLKDVHDAIDEQVRVDEQGRPTKAALILDSRGFYKSTLDMVDCVQWMLNVPDIRILIMTAERRLSNDFMRFIKKWLYLPEVGEPTDFQLLFPEYVLRKSAGRSNTPILLRCRKIPQVQPTILATSIESGFAGVHCDIKKNDDVVNEQNSNTEPTRTKLKDLIDNSDNLRGSWGFTDYIGTRYRVDDWYGARLQIRDEKDQPIKYFCRACWTRKPEYEKVPLKALTEDMVILTFPQLSKHPWVDLKEKLDANEPLFRCQQLNEPALTDDDFRFKVVFLEDSLRRHTYPVTNAPDQGDIFIAWDWALTANKRSDYSAGVVAKRWEKDARWNLTILEVRWGQWKLSELAEEIARLDKKWNPRETMIELIPGVELFKQELMMWYHRFGFDPRLHWLTPSNEPDAKRNRIKQLEILLNEDRLWFAFGHGAWIDETFNQLTRYTGERKNRGRHDDIPDAMSMLYQILPGYVPTKEELDSREKLWAAQRHSAAQIDFYNRIFKGDPTPQIHIIPETNEVKQIDPRNKVFGTNGMHI